MNQPALQVLPETSLSFQKVRRITVLYNNVNNLSYGEVKDLLADEDTVTTAWQIYQQLAADGFQVELYELNENTVSKLFEIKTDLFFNLCYGIGSLSRSEAEVAKILKKTGIPFTGGDTKAIRLTNDKIATKKKFYEHQITTPSYQVFVSKNDPLEEILRYPLIVKPVHEDCSLGIHNDSVVTDEDRLRDKVETILKKYREPALVEEYIEGRELNVTILGNNSNKRMLPISEIIFGSSYQDGKWKIVDFEAKWILQSSNYQETNGVCPTILEEKTKKQIEDLALRAYDACFCRDYARVDLRLSKEQIPYFLEINLNPGIGPNDGAVRSALAAGMTYSSFLKEIIHTAVVR